MELIIKLILGAIGFGGLSWYTSGLTSPNDGWMTLIALVFGLIAFAHAFLVVAKIVHYSRWGAAVFWIGMVATLLYTFPPFELSQIGWLGWGGTAVLSVLSLFIVTYEPGSAPKEAGRGYGSNFDPCPATEGIDHSGHPTETAINRGLY